MFIFKLIRYAMEMQLVMFLALYCKLFNINNSSNQIGFLARKYGPKLGISKRANQNLKNALPNLSNCLLYTSPSPRDQRGSRMPSSA